MDICLVGTDVGPSVNGSFVRGHVSNIVRISRELNRLGHNVHIITNIPEFSHPLLYEKWVRYAEVSYFPTMFSSLKENGPEFLIKALHRVILDINKKKFDIVNVHSGFPALATLSALIRKFTKVKTVHTLYSPFDYAFNDSILDEVFFSTITRSSFSLLDKVVAVSENVRRSLLFRHVSKDKITVIPPALSEEFFCSNFNTQNMRLILEIDEAAPVITYIGGFEDGKGLMALMQIIPKVVSKIPDVTFIVVLNRPTDDPRLKMLEKDLQKRGFSKNVRLTGITDRIVDILRIGDVFVAPYLHTMGVADYPLAISEAMALGKVVIAFDIGGISEMLNEKRGITIRLGDITSFVENSVRLIRNEAERNKIGEAASEFVIQNFSAETVTSKTIDLFNELVDNKPR
jgi:glycosyltransferase involved in cell wall biosynthesis